MQWYFKHSQTHESAQRILREPPTNKQAVTYFLAVTALHQNLNEDRVEEMEVAAGIEGAEVLVEALKSFVTITVVFSNPKGFPIIHAPDHHHHPAP